MNVPEQVAKLCQSLPPDKQEAVLDFVEFLVSRQWHTSWTVEKRQEAVARTMGLVGLRAYVMHRRQTGARVRKAA